MRFFVSIFLMSIFALDAMALSQYENMIQQQAQSIDLHERQFLYATQALSQAQIDYTQYKAQYPLEQSLFRLASHSGKVWSANPNKQKEKHIFKQLPLVLKEINNGILAHANALKLSVLDLPRFYQLASDPDFAFLFNMHDEVTVHHQHSAPTIILLDCAEQISDCDEPSARTSITHVASLWQLAEQNDLQHAEEFIVRYSHTSTLVSVREERWIYYDHIGPRFYKREYKSTIHNPTSQTK